MLRKLAMGLSFLALLSAAAATISLLNVPYYNVTETVQTESGYDSVQVTKTLVSVNGRRVVYLLIMVTLASGVPFIVALMKPSLQRMVTWIFALLLLVFSIAGSFTIGLFFMPSVILLIFAGIVTLFTVKEPVH